MNKGQSARCSENHNENAYRGLVQRRAEITVIPYRDDIREMILSKCNGKSNRLGNLNFMV
jgi:hypothetical protein